MIVYHELTLFDVSPRGGVRARANLGRVDGRDRGDVVVSSGRGEPPLRFPRVDTYARASVMNGRLPVAPPTREALVPIPVPQEDQRGTARPGGSDAPGA